MISNGDAAIVLSGGTMANTTVDRGSLDVEGGIASGGRHFARSSRLSRAVSSSVSSARIPPSSSAPVELRQERGGDDDHLFRNDERAYGDDCRAWL